MTLLGDPAHAMRPYMAQGAVQSIEDAAVLAKCLEWTDADDVGAALARYMNKRASLVRRDARKARAATV